jgi:hypothetical protein
MCGVDFSADEQQQRGRSLCCGLGRPRHSAFMISSAAAVPARLLPTLCARMGVRGTLTALFLLATFLGRRGDGSSSATAGLQPLPLAAKAGFLRAHNAARCARGLPSLAWNDSAAAAAAAVASRCVFVPSTPGGSGESIYGASFLEAPSNAAAAAVAAFVAEQPSWDCAVRATLPPPPLPRAPPPPPRSRTAVSPSLLSPFLPFSREA